MTTKKKRPLREIISELEELGYEVDIKHNRLYDVVKSVSETDTIDYVIENRVAPRGGWTVAHIIKDGAIVVSAEAICSKHENYSRKIGALIALGRARKELGV
jgi:hypothetical protein